MEYKKTTHLTKEVTKELNAKGVRISDKGVKLVIDSYLSRKRQSLVEGYTIVEEGIGDLVPAIRRCNTFEEGKTSITTKLIAKIDRNLRDEVKEGMLTSEEVYRRLGGTKLSEEEYLNYSEEFQNA